MARSVEMENEQELLRWLRNGYLRRELLKDLLANLQRHATHMQRVYAPIGDSMYIHRHIHAGPQIWLPGGAYGGGTYQRSTGVRRGTSMHPLYVHFGTAQPEGFSQRGLMMAGGLPGRIYPKGGSRAPASVLETRRERLTRSVQDPKVPGGFRRPALTFQKRGEGRRFRAWVSGQRPQPYVYLAYQSTAIYARGEIRAAMHGLLDQLRRNEIRWSVPGPG
jgi:hypothetical protein